MPVETFDFISILSNIQTNTNDRISEIPKGNYEIILEVTNEFGCVYSDAMNLEVMECVEVKEQELTSLQVYPVPANNELHIQNLPSDAERIVVMDMMGHVVMSESINQNEQMSLEVSNIASGKYVISVQCADRMMNQFFSIAR